MSLTRQSAIDYIIFHLQKITNPTHPLPVTEQKNILVTDLFSRDLSELATALKSVNLIRNPNFLETITGIIITNSSPQQCLYEHLAGEFYMLLIKMCIKLISQRYHPATRPSRETIILNNLRLYFPVTSNNKLNFIGLIMEYEDSFQGEVLASFKGGFAYSLDLCPDNKIIVGSYKEFTIWDLNTRKFDYKIMTELRVDDIKILPSKEILLIEYKQFLKLAIWKPLINKVKIIPYQGMTNISQIGVLPNSYLVFTARQVPFIIWNTIENKIESSFSEESEKNGTALLVTSDKIIVAFESGIGIWYFKDNEFKFGAPTISLPLDGFNRVNPVDLLLELPNNKLVSKSYNNIKIWDLSAKRCLCNFGHFRRIITFIVVKEELIVSYEDHSVKIWNLMNEASVHSFISPIGVINYMELLPGGEVLMICEVGGTMGVWENNKLNYDFNSFESQITKAKVLTNGNVILSFINGSILVLK